jgi:hypothetical protein
VIFEEIANSWAGMGRIGIPHGWVRKVDGEDIGYMRPTRESGQLEKDQQLCVIVKLNIMLLMMKESTLKKSK